MLFEENPIDGQFAEYECGAGGIRLAGQSFHKPVLVDYPEILIIGTGAAQEFIHPKIMADFSRIGISVECMNTDSAFRTLVFLHSEGRRAWAWLQP
ncbi:MTH938/NDUFAF3 family protein [Neisseria gonorrhoeae]|uniref:MTH938/NDUFAF3 family protein n=1 Tax=Neisseria gonorrhoeae TaxID=485 RepID=UPI001F4D9F55|nr:MTH938/NDUFAF3 family protein [Neisseria gonorrhoeae]MCH8781164.1 hypothetical protein [Neisseria gonorrhoeae]